MLPRRFLPAALAAVLAATGCTSLAPGAEEHGWTGFAETTDASPEASEHPGSERTDDGTATEDPAGAAESYSSAEAHALRDATASQLNAGEPGVPRHSGASVDDVLRLGAVATWVDSPEVFAVSMPASSDCWASAGEPVVAAEDRLVVAFVQEESCESPDAARTYTLRVPEGVDAAAGLELAIVGLQHEFTLTLPPG
jgi:hypothetical protein